MTLSSAVNDNPQHFIHEINTIAYDASDVNLFLRKLMTFLRKKKETVVPPLLLIFFLKLLPLKDDELVMSEMLKNGGSATSFWREHARKNTSI